MTLAAPLCFFTEKEGFDMPVLVTGGAGYIGSHTCVELINAGYDIVVLDNFYNSKPECLRRLKKITGKDFPFYECDVLDKQGLAEVFSKEAIEAVIHFAGLKAVGESVRVPLKYYHNNITGTLTLCQVMNDFGVKTIVFSSSATVYGSENKSPYNEDMPAGGCTNPYGQTKFMIEIILKDLHQSDVGWNISVLRYFNPIGAHESGLIGEDPSDIPNNLMPYITQVAVGKQEILKIFGNNYPTPDGTGVRDYIHVVDLAKGHLKALEAINGYSVYNLGTGKGTSVLELVAAFEAASGVKIPTTIAPRREGDLATSYATVEKAKKELSFTAKYDINRMCADSWRWQSQNPKGFVAGD